LAKVPPAQLGLDDLTPIRLSVAKVHELTTILLKHARIFGDDRRNVQAIRNLILDPNTLLWEIPGKALFYLTDVVLGNRAYAHLVLYGGRDVRRCRPLLKAMIKEAFANLHLHRMGALIPTSNRPAVLLARTLGFRREGLLRESEMRDGRWASLLMFGLLDREI